MLKGMYMTLMIGPAVPVPVSQEVLDALTSVQIVTSAGETASGFELTFTLSNRSPLHTIFLLAGGASIPLVRVVIVMTINGTPDVLIDDMLKRVQANSPLHSLEIELTTSPLSSARELGLSEDWVKKLTEHSPSKREVLAAVRDKKTGDEGQQN